MNTDEMFMQIALKEAAKAYEKEEVPVGAVITVGEKIIAKAHNQVELLKDSTAHAEIIALTAAFQNLGSKYLTDATLYVTIEPCLMCCGAMYWSKLKGIVFGAPDEKNGYRRSTADRPVFHPKTQIKSGILAEECAALMQQFFKEKRRTI